MLRIVLEKLGCVGTDVVQFLFYFFMTFKVLNPILSARTAIKILNKQISIM